MPGFFTRRSYYESKIKEIESLKIAGNIDKAKVATDNLLNETSGISILLYHDIAENNAQYSVSPDKFEKQMEIIAKLGLAVIPLNKIQNHIDNSKPAIIITFDDAREGILKYGHQILKKFNYPYTIYIAPQYIDKPETAIESEKFSGFMKWDEIDQIVKEKVNIGSHSISHANLTKLTAEECEYEIIESKNILEKRYGQMNDFAYPFGQFNESIEIIGKNAGYKTLSTILTGVNGKNTSLFRLKRNLVLRMLSEKDFTFLCDPKEINEKALRLKEEF